MNRKELLDQADALAKKATTVSPSARGFNSYSSGGAVLGAGQAVVEEIEALRLTMLALFGPLAEAVDVGLALLKEWDGD